ASHFPSAEKARECTEGGASGRTATSSPVVASQTLTLAPAVAAASRCPSPLNARRQLVNTRPQGDSFPLSASRSFRTPSPPATATWREAPGRAAHSAVPGGRGNVGRLLFAARSHQSTPFSVTTATS